ncbi:hypothetical protein EYF80_055417 [Scomber scombrus]|uniref:C3H1-type domain-containing protein n=1 Tax=Scomber scombrus TaxID=13677 RepID=A0AAV1QCY3_SCOSC
MSDSETGQFEADQLDSAFNFPTTRRSVRIAARHEDASEDTVEILKAQGITPTPGLEVSQLRALVSDLLHESPDLAPSATSAQSGNPGRKRTRKSKNTEPQQKRPTSGRSGQPNQVLDAAQSPNITSTLQSLAASMQEINARLQSLENAHASTSVAASLIPQSAAPSAPAPLIHIPVSYPAAIPSSLVSAVSAPMIGRPYVPSGANISPRLRGKDINMISLILPSPEWDVICMVYPERRQELDTYLALIGVLNLKYGKNIFFQYHKAFSSKAALYISQSNTCLNWSVLDTEILVMVVGGSQAISCITCGNKGHTEELCPMLPFLPDGERALKCESCSSPFPAQEKTDARGRKVLLYNNQPICNNFNENVCTYPNCIFLHICSNCKDAHPKSVCPQRFRPLQSRRGARRY